MHEMGEPISICQAPGAQGVIGIVANNSLRAWFTALCVVNSLKS